MLDPRTDPLDWIIELGKILTLSVTNRAAFLCMTYLNFTLSYLNSFYLTYHIALFHPDSSCFTWIHQVSP
jgi:hypothetical protein